MKAIAAIVGLTSIACFFSALYLFDSGRWLAGGVAAILGVLGAYEALDAWQAPPEE